MCLSLLSHRTSIRHYHMNAFLTMMILISFLRQRRRYCNALGDIVPPPFKLDDVGYQTISNLLFAILSNTLWLSRRVRDDGEGEDAQALKELLTSRLCVLNDAIQKLMNAKNPFLAEVRDDHYKNPIIF